MPCSPAEGGEGRPAARCGSQIALPDCAAVVLMRDSAVSSLGTAAPKGMAAAVSSLETAALSGTAAGALTNGPPQLAGVLKCQAAAHAQHRCGQVGSVANQRHAAAGVLLR